MRPKHFRQRGPRDQMAVVRMALEGHGDNFMEGVTDKSTFAKHLAKVLEDLKSLESFLPELWPDGTS
jgi:hypothetical protein